ncbi:unnamed protein product [Ilex paraguariensis]|uniref:C2H2-type domain-containing protein n=1 Tax=Ilex paraguariensis TaxID=185542 RepID=A0ABC8RW51_9AQUA
MEDDKENQLVAIEKDDRKSETPVSVDVKLRVVLSIPKVEEVGDKGLIGPRSQEKDHQIRVCPECHKGFSSGKALGGHMRIHVQKSKQPKKTNKFKEKHKHEAIGVMKKKASNVRDKGKPNCALCGKKFPSMKSLFGHMRCHPERDWRGIQPPAGLRAKNSPSSSVSDPVPPQKIDDQIDSADPNGTVMMMNDLTTQPLRGWSVTAKRGRKGEIIKATPTLSSSEDEHEQFLDAANDLLRLAHGEPFQSSLTQKHRFEEYEATNSNSPTHRAEIEETNRISTDNGSSGDAVLSKSMNIDKGKGKALLERGCSAEKSVDHTGYQWDDKDWPKESEQLMNYKYCESTNAKTSMIKNKKKRKKMKLMDLELSQDISPDLYDQKFVFNTTSTTVVPVQFRCSTCDKSFPSHQALGGHRSSHNKIRVQNQNAIEESSSAAAEVENPGNPISQQYKIRESELAACSHQCQICNRTFPTGQALGGHKRCHWNGTRMEAPSSQDEASQIMEPKVLDFDLNEMPPMENECGFESEHATDYGDSSSAFNLVA